jgi:hypothetical protein
MDYLVTTVILAGCGNPGAMDGCLFCYTKQFSCLALDDDMLIWEITVQKAVVFFVVNKVRH